MFAVTRRLPRPAPQPSPAEPIFPNALPPPLYLAASSCLREHGKQEAAVSGGESASLQNSGRPSHRPSNTLSVLVEGIGVEALLDTGASISIIHESFCSRLRKVKTPYSGPALRGANSATIKPSGLCTARFLSMALDTTFSSRYWHHAFPK